MRENWSHLVVMMMMMMMMMVVAVVPICELPLMSMYEVSVNQPYIQSVTRPYFCDKKRICDER